uniref:BCAS3 WD40 domain-containing protein n=1 Tax=Stomoxys calcitrans TaxID=35570 RepID=A0A1I8NQE3_STOCA
MSADSPRRSTGNTSRGLVAVPSIVPPQVVSDRSILDSAIGFINEVTLAHPPHTDPKDTITWARFETAADISDPRFGEDWELDGNVAPPLLLILGYGLGVQVWAIPANGEAVEVLSWRHGIVSALRVLPTPSTSTGAIEENGRADEPIDVFADKRPLIALVDGSSSSGAQPQFCAVNFISLKTGTQVKAIKFKNPVIDVLANRSSIVITFHERIAVFDARTLEDRLSITTCYPSPGINPNPIALGPRWLAYAEHKLLHSKRSGGGCDGEGVASYTATVLNASKSLVKGLRELGEQVAAGLTGTTGSTSSSKNPSFDSGIGPDSKQSGVVTIIDIKHPLRDFSPTSGVPMSSSQSAGTDPIVAHFIAHSEALVAMEFDNSGMLLVTADRRGHDFHVFRIQANPVGSSLAAVHHLYVLHRGDTSAKVQNISFSLDSRWVAVSTLRGTTHVFPITPYGGPMGVRTHTSLHVVNKLSRFHRSAGLSAEGRSNSPITHSESTTFSLSLQPYHNPTLPPYPRPTVVMPLAQLRQPFALGSPPGSATIASGKSGPGAQGSGSQRQRLSSLSDDSGKPLSVCAIFAKSRSWLLDPPNVTREAPHRMQRKAVDSLFVMAGHGALIQYDLDTKLASNVAKEKICDDTPIELEVEAKAQWNLGRRKEGSQEITPPLTLDNWLVKNRNSCMLTDSTRQYDDSDDRGESWLAQVEIVTHAGPHRRLWMGPQFVFKTYNTPSGSNLSHVDIEAVEIGTNKTTTTTTKPEHSSPLNMPLTAAGRSSAVPVLIESGSYSSIEQSPKLMDRFRHDHLDSDYSVAHGDTRLKEDLADAMRESPSVSATSKESGGGRVSETGCSSDNIAFYDALAEHDDQDQESDFLHDRNASVAALASALPNIYSYDNSSSYESIDSLKKPNVSIEKIVNPLGTVTTVTSCLTAEVKKDILDEVVSQLAAEDTVIHENCDESLFRPVVAIFCDEKTRLRQEEEALKNQELCQPPENISNKLIVPVIAKEVDDALNKKEKQKNISKIKPLQGKEQDFVGGKEQRKFEEMSALNKKSRNEEEKPMTTKEKQKEKEKEKLSLEKNKDKASTAESQNLEIKPRLPKENEEEVKSKTKSTSEIHETKEISKVSRKESDTSLSATKDSERSNKPKVEEENSKLGEESEKDAQQNSETKNSAKTKERQRKSEERDSLERDSTKESSRSSADKEMSPKPQVTNKKATKPSTTDDSEDDKPLEFMRMTPGKVEKATVAIPTKSLSKKELKKQQQQKAKEAEEAKINEKKKIDKEKEEQQKKVEEEKGDREEKFPETPSKKKLKDKTDEPKETLKDFSVKGEELSKNLNIKREDSNKDSPTEAALTIKRSSIEKTATIVKENTEEELPSKREITKSATNKEAKINIKTEQLNVKDLADSLMEIQTEDSTSELEKLTSPLETVEVFTIPSVTATAKVSKKNKKKGNKSGSSSETEEIIEMPQTSKKKSSISSEESFPDIADRLLERKDDKDMEETMYVSFTLTEVRKKPKDKAEKENPKEKAEKSLAKLEEESKETENKRKKSFSGEQQEEKVVIKKDSKDSLASKKAVKETEISNKEKSPLSNPELKSNKKATEKIVGENISEEKNEKKTVPKLAEKTTERKTKPLSKQSSVESIAEENTKSVKNVTEESDKEKLVKNSKTFAKEKISLKDMKTKEPLSDNEGSDEESSIKVSKSDKNVKEKSDKEKESIKTKEDNTEEKSLKLGKIKERGKEDASTLKEIDESDKEKRAKASKVKANVKDNTAESEEEKLTKAGKAKENIEDSEKSKQEKTVKEKSMSSEASDNEKYAKESNDKSTEEKSTKGKKISGNNKNENESEDKKLGKAKVLEKSEESGKDKVKSSKDIKLVEECETKKDEEVAKKKPQGKTLDDNSREDKKKDQKLAEAAKESAKAMQPLDSETKSKVPDAAKAKESLEEAKLKKTNSKDDTSTKVDNFASKLSSKPEVIVEQPKLQVKQKKEEMEKQMAAMEKETTKEPSKATISSKAKPTPPSSPKNKAEKLSKGKSEEAEDTNAGKLLQKSTPPNTTKGEQEIQTNTEKEEEFKKPTWASISKPGKPVKADDFEKEYKVKVSESHSQDTLESKTPKITPTSPRKSAEKSSSNTGKDIPTPSVPPPPPPVTSAWKTMSGAEMIAQNLNKQDTKTDKAFHSLGGAIPKATKAPSSEKLLPELPTPKEMKEPMSLTKSSPKKSKSNSSTLDDFPILKPLDALPPLPTLEPLELIGEAANRSGKDVSLINFESPLQENPALERKITPPPRGFTEQNLIFALCGSLHYENEQRSRLTPEKSDVSPTTPSSSNRSSSALDEPSMADYKSLTENDDPYISLEQSSQDTYTTNTNTTNDKFSSSTNSSGTEEIIIMEEKKMTKKQKRKRQQQLLELQKQKEQQLQQHHHHHQHHHHQMDDDELRPLIAMSESQIENIAIGSASSATMPSLLDESFSLKPLITKSNTLTHSTTTDSEGPMPATTSDDNVFIMPSSTNTGTSSGSGGQHKIKTKKLEHKINLMAAIEAATSSSTSSAEESGVELGGGGRSHDADDHPVLCGPSSLISSASAASSLAASSSILPPLSMAAVVAAGGSASHAPMTLNASAAAGALKKKTKRRKR